MSHPPAQDGGNERMIMAKESELRKLTDEQKRTIRRWMDEGETLRDAEFTDFGRGEAQRRNGGEPRGNLQQEATNFAKLGEKFLSNDYTDLRRWQENEGISLPGA